MPNDQAPRSLDDAIDRLRAPSPQSFDYDAIAELAPFKEHDIRFRRRLDLDGCKYSIILPENIPPTRDGESPLYLVARFLRHGEAWPAADASFQHANVVTHLAEALWERVYVAPAAEVEPPAPLPQGPSAAAQSMIDNGGSIITAEKLDRMIATLRPDNKHMITFAEIKTILRLARHAFDPKQGEDRKESALVMLKIMTEVLRPLLKAHRLSDVFKAPAGRECICGKLVADVDGWIEHVLALFAYGDAPPYPEERVNLSRNGKTLVELKDAPDGFTDKLVSSGPHMHQGWRSVPVTAGTLFDALGRVEQQSWKDRPEGVVGALSCEIERVARAMTGGEV